MILDFLLDEVGYYCVKGYYLENNPASGKVLKKCEMYYVNTHKKNGKDKITNEMIDIIEYEIKK